MDLKLKACSSAFRVGLSVVESLSLRTPVIGADIAGIREIIGKSNAGILFDSGNEEELKKENSLAVE